MVDYILEAFKPVSDLFDSVGDFWNDTLGFGDASIEGGGATSQIPASTMSSQVSNNSTQTNNFNITESKDPRATAGMVYGQLTNSQTATYGNYSWTRGAN